MVLSEGFFDLTKRQGLGLLADVMTRDNLHLAPKRISRAALSRLRTGLRALEAYLKRVILLLALKLEPELTPNTSIHVKHHKPRPHTTRVGRLAILSQGRDWPGTKILQSPMYKIAPRGAPVLAAPYLDRLTHIKKLIEAPEKRARRLAYYLARRRPGWLLPPGPSRFRFPARFGTEISALYTGMAQAIYTACKIRPSSIGPKPRAPPRISVL